MFHRPSCLQLVATDSFDSRPVQSSPLGDFVRFLIPPASARNTVYALDLGSSCRLRCCANQNLEGVRDGDVAVSPILETDACDR